MKGIEPSSTAWEAAALPLCYTREVSSRTIHIADWHEQAIGEGLGWHGIVATPELALLRLPDRR